jgi:phosphoserine aminotransferase
VIDFSSHVASRPVDWSRVGLAFGGAQKNLGPAGLTLVVVREDLLGHALPICPSAFDYKTWPTTSRCTTRRPPGASTWRVWFQWLKRQEGGHAVPAIEQRNIAKADCCTTPSTIAALRQQGGGQLPLAHERALLPA